MNRDKGPIIALDVGGSSVKSALMKEDGRMGRVCIHVIQSQATADEILKAIHPNRPIIELDFEVEEHNKLTLGLFLAIMNSRMNGEIRLVT